MTERRLHTMQGYSMYPSLKPRDQGLLENVPFGDLHIGDILVFEHNGKHIAHRLVEIQQQAGTYLYRCKGDKNAHADPLIKAEQIRGRLTGYLHENRFHSLTSLRQKAIRFNSLHIHRWVQPLRTRRAALHARMHTLHRSFRIITQYARKAFLRNAVAAFFQGLLPFVGIYCIKRLIDLLTNPGLQTNGHLQSVHYWWIALTAFSFLANGILTAGRAARLEPLLHGIRKHSNQLVHRKHGKLSLSVYEQSEQLDKLYKAHQEMGFRPVKMINGLLGLIKSTASLGMLLFLFLEIHPLFIVLLLVALLPGIAARVSFARRRHQLKEIQTRDQRRMSYLSRILSSLPFAKERRLLNYGPRFEDEFQQLEQDVHARQQTLLNKAFRADVFSQVFAILLIFSSLLFVVQQMLAGIMGVGTVVLFFFVFQRGYGVLGETFNQMTQLHEDRLFWQDFLAFLDLPESNDADVSEPISLQEGIQLNHLSFQYANSRRPALNDIHVFLPKGKTIALVGGNGSGKSTLIKLLCGFYPPTQGEILVDGRSLHSIPPNQWRRNLAAVFQDYALYHIPADENIALGNNRTPKNSQRIREAAQAANIHDLLERLPEGYNTVLGHTFSNGEELSLGQWQKIAIARAIYRDAPLILLDEPSSALDPEAEQRILADLRRLGQGKTTLMVSHRLRTVQHADLILVLSKGILVEQGNHETLMQRKGEYYRLQQASLQ